MEQRHLTCIGCPLGCRLTVKLEREKILSVTGNTCKRGEEYAKKEVTSPTRILTTTVRIEGGRYPVVPVKTERDIPKDKIRDCMEELKAVLLHAPVKVGDVVMHNAGHTGVNVVATSNCCLFHEEK